MNKLYKIIRPLLRQICANILPSPVHPQRHIAIFGFPRTGTSWLAKAISLAKDVSYYYEADHRLKQSYKNLYVPDGKEDEYLYSYVKKMLSGRIVDEYIIAEQGLKEQLLRPFCHTVLIKGVWLILCLNWVLKNFPKLILIQTIRHPVPQFLSWQERRWEVDYFLNNLLSQNELTNDALRPFVSYAKQARTYWQKAGVLWGMMTYIQVKTKLDNPDSLLVQHEWLCLNAEKHIRCLVERLGLHWNDDISEFLTPHRKQKSGPGYGQRRDSSKEITKWWGRVSPGELEELKNMLKHFDLPFYRNLDPYDICTPFNQVTMVQYGHN